MRFVSPKGYDFWRKATKKAPHGGAKLCPREVMKAEEEERKYRGGGPLILLE